MRETQGEECVNRSVFGPKSWSPPSRRMLRAPARCSCLQAPQRHAPITALVTAGTAARRLRFLPLLARAAHQKAKRLVFWERGVDRKPWVEKAERKARF